MKTWILSAIAIVAVALAAVVIKMVTYKDPYHDKVANAGFELKSASINGVSITYAEGPDNGPPLVLLHAQLLDWFSYSRVLPELARSFHVFDVDYPGHGRTVPPPDYPMTANRIGADLADFIAQQVGGPVFVTGNSSGGLLATWLAANRPDLIKAALLEDPPLFSAEYPRIKETIANRAFKTSFTAGSDHPANFLLYWTDQNSAFFRNHVGPGVATLLSASVRLFHLFNPGKPAEIGFIANDTVRMLIRGLDQYDPRFGAAFYAGSWNEGFDHADALRRIACPVLLIHANFSILPDGTLNGAMSDADADKAISLLRNGKLVRVQSDHVVNLDKPEEFIRLLTGFFLHGTTD